MPLAKLIKIFPNGEVKEDVYFERTDKTFTQELRENLTLDMRKRVSKHIKKVLERSETASIAKVEEK